jgi:inner membrane protein
VAFGPLGFLWRRTVTHCLPGAALLALAASFLFRRLYPHFSFKAVFGLTLLGIGGHVFADLWNSYGVVLYWPFSERRVQLDWVFVLDLGVWAILGVAVVVARLLRPQEARIWTGALGLLAVYVGFCGFASRQSRKVLSSDLAAGTATAPKILVYPEPFGPHRFRLVTQEGNEEAVYQVWPFKNRTELLDRLELEQQNPIVAAARRSEAGRKLDEFLSTPVWRLAPDGQNAVVYGLGFRTKLFRARAPFVFRVAPDGRVWRVHGPFVLKPDD